ncbi:MAG: hypothetical protein ACRDH8_12500 [Actinomycetota bacterium]
MAGTVTVRLPEAPPEHYLRWMVFWRDVELIMGQTPTLAEAAAEESAPFIRDEVADFLSRDVVGSILKQAREARDAGSETVIPVLVVDRDLLRQGAEYVVARGMWLERPGVLEAMGVAPLEEHLAHLRARAVEEVRRQLAE